MNNKEVKSSKFNLTKRLLIQAKKYQKIFIFCIFLMLLSIVIKTLGPVFIQKAIDEYIKINDFSGLVKLFSVYIFILVLGYIVNYWEIVFLETTGQKIIAEIKKTSFEKLMLMNQSFFDKSATGKILSRIENDTDSMKIIFTSVITNFIGSILLFFSMIFVMAFFYSSKIAFSILTLIPFIIIAAYFFDKFMSPRLVNIRKYIAEVSGYISEIVNGINIIQIFNQEKRILNNLEEKSNKKYKSESFISIMFNSFFNLLFFVEVLGTLIVLSIGVELVIKKEMTVGSLVLFINFIRYLIMPIIELSGQFNEFQKGISSAIRVFELIDDENIEEDIISNNNFDMGKNVSIEFKDVWFRYNENDNWVLKGVSFYVDKSTSLAIVGHTGSGKTTITNLLMKFYNAQKGEILINGLNIKDIPVKNLRNKISLVLQDNILFPGTIMENIKLDKKTEDENIIALINDLPINKVIKNLNESYYTKITENASNLSAGEKQVISIARALVKEPSIIILDEATSNIDPNIEKDIKTSLNKILKNNTSIIIAHRLSTIKNSDKIMVIDKGEIIEFGSHQELIDLNGFYSKLFSLQTSV